MKADPANVGQPREPEMPDVEAARLLRMLADHPREAFIWPMRHRWAWPGNVREALLRAAERLESRPLMEAAPETATIRRDPPRRRPGPLRPP